METKRVAKPRTIVKNLGKLGKRTFLEFLFIGYPNGSKVDATISFSIGRNHGTGISLLCPCFLMEINLLPLTACTHTYYMENG